MLNPRQVEAFRAVMATGSMTSAATTMHVTQPAVSRLIRDLELDGEVPLFERRGNRMAPTAEAGRSIPEVERAFVGLSRISQFAEELRSRQAGSLRIAGMPALTCGFLPRHVGRFVVRRPEGGDHAPRHALSSHRGRVAAAARFRHAEHRSSGPA